MKVVQRLCANSKDDNLETTPRSGKSPVKPVRQVAPAMPCEISKDPSFNCQTPFGLPLSFRPCNKPLAKSPGKNPDGPSGGQSDQLQLLVDTRHNGAGRQQRCQPNWQNEEGFSQWAFLPAWSGT